MNVLLIGGGGREHAMALGISRSPLCKKLYIAPGNTGTASLGENTPLKADDFNDVYKFVNSNQISLVVVGPELPLVEGLADFLNGLNIAVIGPGKGGARLEGSKEFAKAFMDTHHIATADFHTFQSWEIGIAKAYADSLSLPIVIKASGLAAGKGVIICETREDTHRTIEGMLSDNWFGLSGKTIVIEKFLKGIEMSVFALSDGYSYKIFPNAKDYKRIGEGDTGPNTGGMGAVSPVPFADDLLMQKIKERIIEPTFKGLKAEEIFYSGFLFFGIMVSEGEPYLLEYNCRMGDPESEVVFPLIENDLVELFMAVDAGRLDTQEIMIKPGFCTTVMLVSQGYPDEYEKGKAITVPNTLRDVTIFHAGTKQEGDEIVTNGGRIMALTAFGNTLEEALSRSYAAAELVQFEGKYYRRDIGKDLR